MKKLWIDTDMGGDIDDALAITLAMNAPQLDLVGISTVYMANEWREGLVRNMMKAYGRPDIPVHRGAETPLIGRWGDDVPEKALPNEAVPALIEAARSTPGLVVAAIGPLTNIALALAVAPDIAKHIKLYIMGGMITRPHPEWNIFCDPEGARIVLESGADITLLGLDVTEQCRLDKEESLALVAGETEKKRFLRGEMERFLTSFNFLPTLHDPLTIAAILWEDTELITYEMMDIRVETRGEFTRGVTAANRHSDNKKIRVAMGVKAQEATERMKALMGE